MTHEIDQYDDDKPVGRVLSRREALSLLGGLGAALVAGSGLTGIALAQTAGTATPAPQLTPSSLPACVVRPELTEGPYFVDGQLKRSDIRIDPTDGSIKEGVPLRIQYRVSDVSGGMCAPLEGAQVDIWHCDALGVYSGVSDPGFDTSEQLWLRGYQVTDEDGIAEFLTIYPGWYSGRAVHIHFKIRTEPESAQGYEFTSQLFFDEALTNLVYAQPPYASKGSPDRPNSSDGIFQQSEGLLTLNVVEDGDGYAAIFDIGLDLRDAATGAADGGGMQGGGFGSHPPRGGRP